MGVASWDFSTTFAIPYSSLKLRMWLRSPSKLGEVLESKTSLPNAKGLFYNVTA